MIELDRKVDSLRDTLEDFIKNTGIEFNKVYNLHMQNQLELRLFQNEMKDFKNETQKQNKEMNKRWGELANKMGTLVEDIVSPSIPRVVKEKFDLPVSDLMVRRKKSLPDGRNKEYDTIAVAGNYVFLNSTKSAMRTNYIDEFITEIHEFRDFFPEYSHYKIIGILATLSIDPSIQSYAEKNGFYVLTLGDTLMEIQNSTDFSPKEW